MALSHIASQFEEQNIIQHMHKLKIFLLWWGKDETIFLSLTFASVAIATAANWRPGVHEWPVLLYEFQLKNIFFFYNENSVNTDIWKQDFPISETGAWRRLCIFIRAYGTFVLFCVCSWRPRVSPAALV